MFKHDCAKHGHRFEPRYDSRPASLGEIEGVSAEGLVKIIEVSKSKTYIYDICVRCGDTIKKK